MSPTVLTSLHEVPHGYDVPHETHTLPRGPLIADADPPAHPVPRMQGPFDESIMESTDSPPTTSPADDELQRARSLSRKPPVPKIDAEARRQQLLDLEEFSEEYSSRWRQKPGAKFHPLWKLVAQISFGVHLLQQNLAKSDEEVLRILQVHVDEVDGFLEDATADFDLAVRDVEERVRFLRLPLEYGETFDTMLNDKAFRSAIIEGNDVIERIIDRTTRAMSNSLLDVTKGIDATAELAKYLDRIGPDWTQDDEKLLEVYNTMRGNAEGWYRCFMALQDKGGALERLLTQLGVLATEMARRAGTASRRHTIEPKRPSHSKTPSPKESPDLSDSAKKHSKTGFYDKPLPPDPLQKLISASVAITDRSSSRNSYHSDGRSPSSPTKDNHDQHDEFPKRTSIPTEPVPTSPNRSSPHRAIERSSSHESKLSAHCQPLDLYYSPQDMIAEPLPSPQHQSAGRPQTRSPTGSDKIALTDQGDFDYSPLNADASGSASDFEKSDPVSRRDPHSLAPLHPSAQMSDALRENFNNPKVRRLTQNGITALPDYPQHMKYPQTSKYTENSKDPQNNSSTKWLVNGRKRLRSINGVFNKKRPLKQAHIAIAV